MISITRTRPTISGHPLLTARPSRTIAPVSVRELVEHLPAGNTLMAILDSFGEAKTRDGRLKLIELNKIMAEPNIVGSFVPFIFRSDGVRFFREVLGLDSVNTNARLLIMDNNGLHRTTDDRQIPNGLQGLPCGLLFEGTREGANASQFYLLNLALPLVSELVDDATEANLLNDVYNFFGAALLGRSYRSQLTELRVQPGTTDSFSFSEELTAAMMRDYGFDGRFKLLTIQPITEERWPGPELVFSNQDDNSGDFQAALCQHSKRLSGKRVVEIGYGSGVNLMLAIRFGARSIWANEASFAYRFLCQWNFQYAFDTGQIEIPFSVDVNTVESVGFTGSPAADVYLFNVPAIKTAATIEKSIKRQGALLTASKFMTDEKFLALFQELRQKLNHPNTIALWRILANFEAGESSPQFPEPTNQLTIERLKRQYKEAPHFAQDREIMGLARALDFLRAQKAKGLRSEAACLDRFCDLFLLSLGQAT